MRNGRAELASTRLRVTRKVEGFGTFERMSLASDSQDTWAYRLSADVAIATETKSYRGVNGDGTDRRNYALCPVSADEGPLDIFRDGQRSPRPGE